MEPGVFEIFKIGIGPSSSHTVDPMRETGRDMQSRFKETSAGGFAIDVTESKPAFLIR